MDSLHAFRCQHSLATDRKLQAAFTKTQWTASCSSGPLTKRMQSIAAHPPAVISKVSPHFVRDCSDKSSLEGTFDCIRSPTEAVDCSTWGFGEAQFDNGTWIAAPLYDRDGRRTLQDVEVMLEQGIFVSMDVLSYNLQSCTANKSLAAGRHMYGLILASGYGTDVVLGSSLVHTFAICGSVCEAKQIFQKLCGRNVFSWTALIEAYANDGENKQAIELYHEMQQYNVDPDGHTFVIVLKACSSSRTIEHGKDIHARIIANGLGGNAYIGSTLVNMYAKCGKLDEAYIAFDRVPNRNVVTWSALMAGYVTHGHGQDAFQLFQQMIQEGVEPNIVTYLSLLKACASLVAFEYGKEQHARILEKGLESDLSIGNALIDMYGKCGSLEGALVVFNRLPHQDVVAWSALIGGYAQHNDYQRASQLFEDMQQAGVKPNEVTYLSLLSACSHMALLKEGCIHFKRMRDQAGIQPTIEHYTSLVDILGKAGCLYEAEDLIQTLPFGAGFAGWISLIDSCRAHKDVNLAKRCFDHVRKLEGHTSLAYMLMSSIYACTDHMKELRNIEELRKYANLYKTPAKACIEINNCLHEFIIGDNSHSQADKIYAKLKMLSLSMTEQTCGSSD